MKRRDLEHLIRAAATIAEDDELVIVGSQSILGRYPDAPAELLVSKEADLYPKNKPERSDLIDGSIGEGSPFHETFGYYAQGVGPTTAVLPAGWADRLIPIRNANTLDKTGWCLEPHDLAIAKLAVGREKDLHFVEVAARHGLLDRATLLARWADTTVDPAVREAIRARIDRFWPGG